MGIFGGTWDNVTRFEIERQMGLVKRDHEPYTPMEELESTAFRDKLDAGLCDKLFEDFRKLDILPWIPHRKMFTVMLAIMVMQSGARISDDNMQHLRNITPQIPDFASSSTIEGFTDYGRAQFLFALRDYVPGTPRSFFETR